MGRPKGTPDKLTSALEKQICGFLEITMPQKLAAEAAGISERTFRNWCQLGKDGIEPYASFYVAVRTARARSAAILTTRSLKGEKGSAAALVLLARRFPEYYGCGSIGETDDADWQSQHDEEIEVSEAGRASCAATEKLHEAIELATAGDGPAEGSSDTRKAKRKPRQ